MVVANGRCKIDELQFGTRTGVSDDVCPSLSDGRGKQSLPPLQPIREKADELSG